jgi:hypothetical protein
MDKILFAGPRFTKCINGFSFVIEDGGRRIEFDGEFR